MNRLNIALTLTFAPFLVAAYHYALVAVMSTTDAAKFIEGSEGSIATAKLDTYWRVINAAPVLGILTAALLAREVTILLKGKTQE